MPKKLITVVFASSAFLISCFFLRYIFKDYKKKKKNDAKKNSESFSHKNTTEEKGKNNNPGIHEQQNDNLVEAYTLVQQLGTTDIVLLEKTLITITNYAAFKQNQDFLRDIGCLEKITSLLKKYRIAMELGDSIPHPGVVNGLANVINNLAVNTENQQHLQGCIPTLIDFVSCDKASDDLQLASLQALTNLSVTSQYHKPYTQLIQHLYDLLDSGVHSHNLQALKILVNLSCNSEMVPHLLAARAPKSALELLSAESGTPLLMRWTTILANILSVSYDRGITSTTLPCEYKAASPETLYSTLHGMEKHAKLKSKIFLLCKHSDEVVQAQATKIHQFFT